MFPGAEIPELLDRFPAPEMTTVSKPKMKPAKDEVMAQKNRRAVRGVFCSKSADNLESETAVFMLMAGMGKRSQTPPTASLP